MLRPLRIVHTSDVHLDDSADGERMQAAFAQVVDRVLVERADLFLIAGDLFDHNRVPASVVDFACNQLARLACRTVLIPGNHDCFNEKSILRRVNLLDAGEHVHLLSAEHGEQLELPDLHAAIWGKGMIEHEPANKPMRGSPDRLRDLWHIGMAHGFYVDYDEPNRSSLITPDEIAGSGFDYLAMGHVHVYAEYRHGSTVACYPGAPASYPGSKHPGSVALVDLIPNEPTKVRRLILGLGE